MTVFIGHLSNILPGKLSYATKFVEGKFQLCLVYGDLVLILLNKNIHSATFLNEETREITSEEYVVNGNDKKIYLKNLKDVFGLGRSFTFDSEIFSQQLQDLIKASQESSQEPPQVSPQVSPQEFCFFISAIVFLLYIHYIKKQSIGTFVTSMTSSNSSYKWIVFYCGIYFDGLGLDIDSAIENLCKKCKLIDCELIKENMQLIRNMYEFGIK